ncbi:hypothetical protein ACVGWF_03725, partial [Enterobacter asburiae]
FLIYRGTTYIYSSRKCSAASVVYMRVGVLCEVTNDYGTLARAPECITFARLQKRRVFTIK